MVASLVRIGRWHRWLVYDGDVIDLRGWDGDVAG